MRQLKMKIGLIYRSPPQDFHSWVVPLGAVAFLAAHQSAVGPMVFMVRIGNKQKQ